MGESESFMLAINFHLQPPSTNSTNSEVLSTNSPGADLETMSEEGKFLTWKVNRLIRETPATELRSTVKALCTTDADLRARLGKILKEKGDKRPAPKRTRKDSFDFETEIHRNQLRAKTRVVDAGTACRSAILSLGLRRGLVIFILVGFSLDRPLQRWKRAGRYLTFSTT